MRIEVITPADWKERFSEQAHLIAFEKHKPREWERIDFALLSVSQLGVPMGYVTCRELDARSLYWQFGGNFPGTRGTINGYKNGILFVDWAKEKYDRVSCYVENGNQAMLKMAMRLGFKITGIRNFRNTILVEHLLEFQGGAE